MARLPEICHAANIAGLERTEAAKVRAAIPAYRVRPNNQPTEAEMLQRLRALHADPEAQLMMFQIFTAGMDFTEEIAFLEKV